MIPLALTTLVVFQTASSPVTPPGEHAVKLLVLDMKNEGAPASLAPLVQSTLTAHLQKKPIDVLSTEDVRRSVDLEAIHMQAGCDDSKCLSELSGALGATHVIYGDVGRIGSLTVVHLSLFDAATQHAVGRENIEVEREEQVPAAVRAAGDRLVASLVPAEAQPAGFTALQWTGMGGGAVGGALAVGGSIFLGSALGTLADPAQPGAAKSDAQSAGRLSLLCAAGGVVLLGAGAALFFVGGP